MSEKLTLIKLGGSVITNKEVPMMVREDVLTRLVREIVRAKEETGADFIIGHGQGSFAHAPALRYRTMEGFVAKDSRIGMAITQDSAAQLNRIVVNRFISENVSAVSFLFSNSLVTSDDQPAHWCEKVLLAYLAKGLLPITSGDVIVDETKGCTIWSTEKILSFLAQELPKHNYQVKKVIHVTEVAGVLDHDQKVIPVVTQKNFTEVQKAINGTKGFDVTGGMKHKLEESLALAQTGIESVILSGMSKDNLYHCLMGQEFVGTIIK